MKVSKRMKAIHASVDTNKDYKLAEAIEVLQKSANAKFVESVDAAIRLGVDPRHADQMVRGTVVLPHGTGKERKVLVVTRGENVKVALEAGADYAGFEEYLEKIKGGWADVDVIVATPDSMIELGKLGKILGPKGLMPNPKSGTVTPNVAQAVKEVKAGKIEFRVDKTGIIHAGLGKVTFTAEQLLDNTKAFVNTVLKLKPATAKGQYVKSLALSTSMGPGLMISKEETAM